MIAVPCRYTVKACPPEAGRAERVASKRLCKQGLVYFRREVADSRAMSGFSNVCKGISPASTFDFSSNFSFKVSLALIVDGDDCWPGATVMMCGRFESERGMITYSSEDPIVQREQDFVFSNIIGFCPHGATCLSPCPSSPCSAIFA